MRARSIVIAVAAAAVVVVAGARTVARLRAPEGLAAGAAAPDFTLPAGGGREVTLSGLRGRVVAVNFWATWCTPCKAEIPDLVAVYAAHRGECFELLGVAADSGTRAEVLAAAKELGIDYPVLFDDDGRAGEAFQVSAYPRTFLVDAEGRLQRTFAGAVHRRQLEAALGPLLAAAPRTCDAAR